MFLGFSKEIFSKIQGFFTISIANLFQFSLERSGQKQCFHKAQNIRDENYPENRWEHGDLGQLDSLIYKLRKQRHSLRYT